ncbi:hypothetical protein DYD21_04915 [Rhodohalobacter sp. SW132]|nr:hypothetical protein DYD21_04915 [Rhodohalobacter sp. SW132]
MPRASRFRLSDRRAENHSAVFKKFDEMFPDGNSKPKMPILFNVPLDTKRIESGHTLVFSADIAVRTTEYRIDGSIFTRQRIPEENIFRENITIRATQAESGNLTQWNIRYNFSDESWGENRGSEAEIIDGAAVIPLKSRKGFLGKLVIGLHPFDEGTSNRVDDMVEVLDT